MGILQQLFRTHSPHYRERFGEKMPATHKKVIDAITRCRTEENGSTLYRCEACGEPHVIYRSCGNRHCPTCQGRKSLLWLERQCARALPTHHFLITFTVPEGLRAFLRAHQRLGYGALFAASAGALHKLCPDPNYLGADTPGFFGVLHTWGRQLQYHPHLHYLVPGGALDSHNQQWHASSPGFYLPVHALSKIFRAQFREAMGREGLLDEIPAAVWAIAWNVNCQAVGAAQASLAYLARYVFKVAISDARILGVDDTHVRFHYWKPRSNRPRTLALPILEFMRRFLTHVLPTGFMKVRYYGFLSPSCSVPIEEVKARIEMAQGFAVTAPEIEIEAPPPLRCRHCGGALKLHRVILPTRRTPSGVNRPAPVAQHANRAALGSGP